MPIAGVGSGLLQAGALRHSVTLQKPGGVRNPATGERQTVFGAPNAELVRKASIRTLSGSEAFIAAQRQASSTHVVTTRWDRGLAVVDASWRILFGTRIFTIDEPPRNVDEVNRTAEFYCTESRRTE